MAYSCYCAVDNKHKNDRGSSERAQLRRILLSFGILLSCLLGPAALVAEPFPPLKAEERLALPAIGLIKIIGSESIVVCSGTLVAQDLVITSAHCLEKYKGRMQRVEFAAGLTGTRSRATSGAAEVVQHPVWSYASGMGKYVYDIAVVRLSRPITEKRVRSINLYPEDAALPERAALVGYPLTEHFILHGRLNCALTPVAKSGLFSSDCSVSKGTSGGAVLIRAANEWQLAGVIVAASKRDGTALVVEIDQWLRDHVQDALRREATRSAELQ